MDNHKIHHPVNFHFAQAYGEQGLQVGQETFPVEIRSFEGGVYCLEVSGRWKENSSQAILTPPPKVEVTEGARGLVIGEDATIDLYGDDGEHLLGGLASGSFGVCGKAWMLEFAYDPAVRFYGMGEKLGPLEKTGIRTKFWNRDVFADFQEGPVWNGQTDPMYVSIPWLIVRTANGWCGILINTPEMPFISAGGTIGAIANQQKLESDTRFYLGAAGGKPEVWFFTAPDLAKLTTKYQKLVGTTPLPPLWSLGHHQCRWGYASPEDLKEVSEGMARFGIPNSALWLDIEYMDRYQVFTWDPELWKGSVPDMLADLQADGQKVVPILDPGVKVLEGYDVYHHGLEAGIYCPTPEKQNFTGYVWPGATHFPDYSTEEGREWWAGQVAAFSSVGLEGYWLDMNDPSVGPVELENMCFGPDAKAHETFHNQYGAGMARATREGMLQANPDKRPFLLARSGWVGCQRDTALWTGDNLSNPTYMNGSVACTLNLALSGVPLNGPDVPGFAKDASEGLARQWYRLGFLFPFLRNHCIKGDRAQEPYSFSRETREEIARLIRLRYRFLPYLYQLWMNQETEGEAVMRPMLYDFDGRTGFDFSRVEDQFMLGPSLLQAPFFFGQHTRSVLLPSEDWFDLGAGVWRKAESTLNLEVGERPVPLFVRSGTILPMLPEDITHVSQLDISRVDMHCFLKPGQKGTSVYRADDGESFAYRKGRRSEVRLRYSVDNDGMLDLEIERISEAWQPLHLRFLTYEGVTAVKINGSAKVSTEVLSWNALGTNLSPSIYSLE